MSNQQSIFIHAIIKLLVETVYAMAEYFKW